MYIVIFCSLIALLLSYLDSREQLHGGTLIGFVIVSFLAVIHYNYGNDYMPYLGVYREVIRYPSLMSVLDDNIYKDVGWSALCYIFQYLGGFFSLVAAISIFEGVVYYKAIKRYLPRHLWWFGTFIYLFTTSFYLLNFSMLRQGLVVAIFFALYPLIMQKKWWIAAPILFVCSFIHGSAIVLIPFAFWGYLPVKNGKVLALLFVLLIALLYVSSTTLSTIQYLAFEATDEFEYYADTYSDSDKTTHFGVGFVIYLIPLILSILYLLREKTDERVKLVVALFCISGFFTPLAQYIPMVGRVGYYFGAASVVVLPLAYDAIRNRSLKVFLIGLCLAIKLYDYLIFFSSEAFSEHYKTFHTVFEHL